VGRGHVEMTVSLERLGAYGLQLDRQLVTAYGLACRELHTEFGFATAPDPVALLRIPGVVVGGLEASLTDLERVQQVVERVANEGLWRLNEMRAREGEALERDLRTRLRKLELLAESIEQLVPQMSALFRRRLEKRLGDLLRDTSGGGNLDAGRLAQEVAYLASRSDIAEEITRFRSHLDQVKRVIEESSEVGKKLDFLLQEMNRETNTVLSKTTDVPEIGSEIGRAAIEMKTEIEKLREQVQNIE